MRSILPTTDYDSYVAAWNRVTRKGYRQFNVDTWAGGHRYLSLTALALSEGEIAQLKQLTKTFTRLLSVAVDGILDDPDWWTSLAWPWPAIELARQEPRDPAGQVSLFGRFDYLLDADGQWQVIEYNADTPSGGREASGLEPSIASLHDLQRIDSRMLQRVAASFVQRIQQHDRPVRLVGVVSTHRWIEDLASANWLASVLRNAGQSALVGDVNDLAAQRGRITLRGRPIDALYRFYPIERLYRHAIFASLCEASLDANLLLLNGLRGFLAQSKACLAWLWANRASFPECAMIERHLPATTLARDPAAESMLRDSVVKHVNGREGDSVVFGDSLDAAGWEARLLEPGYVVQRAVRSAVVEDVKVDDTCRQIECIGDRVACVGGFSIGGQFGGCYTRLDGPITSARASYVATLCERA